MTGNAEFFDMVMDKYRLVDPISADEQAFILKSRKKVLKAILKKYQKFSVVLWLVIAVAMLFRNIGIKLSFIQAKAILAAALAAAAAGSSAATYAGAKYVYDRMQERDVMEIREVAPPKVPDLIVREIPEPKPAAEAGAADEQKPDSAEKPRAEVPRGHITVPSM